MRCLFRIEVPFFLPVLLGVTTSQYLLRFLIHHPLTHTHAHTDALVLFRLRVLSLFLASFYLLPPPLSSPAFIYLQVEKKTQARWCVILCAHIVFKAALAIQDPLVFFKSRPSSTFLVLSPHSIFSLLSTFFHYVFQESRSKEKQEVHQAAHASSVTLHFCLSVVSCDIRQTISRYHTHSLSHPRFFRFFLSSLSLLLVLLPRPRAPPSQTIFPVFLFLPTFCEKVR